MFGLDPQSIVDRVTASGRPVVVPRWWDSILRGLIGFTLVSLAGFGPWALAGRWFYRNLGEGGLYAVCAVLFIGLSGLLLHRLILGPGSLVRFYQIFTLAFAAYSIAWTAGWMALHGHAGSLVGLLAGTAVMGALLAHAFAARSVMLKVILILFVTNTLGYFIGGWAYEFLAAQKQLSFLGLDLSRTARGALAKSSWGLFYGLGFGAGLGAAFHLCQTRARELLFSRPN